MHIIVMSTPGRWENYSTSYEVETVTELFEAGLAQFHLRKPTYSVTQLKDWLDKLNPKYLPRIVLHSFHDLALDYNVGGIHLSERQRKRCLQSREQVDFLTKQMGHLKLSSSFHTLVDLRFAPKIYQYAFISPVFDSVSKPHHTAAFHRDELQRAVAGSRNLVIALGGVTAERIPTAQYIGFHGVGLLGAIWKSNNPIKSYLQVVEACQEPDSSLFHSA